MNQSNSYNNKINVRKIKKFLENKCQLSHRKFFYTDRFFIKSSINQILNILRKMFSNH